MRLCAFVRGPGDQPRAGLLLAGGEVVVDLTLAAAGIPQARRPSDWCDLDGPCLPAVAALARAIAADPSRLEALRPLGAVVPREDARLVAPVQSPGKIICIGLNYRDHAAESGMAIPKSPVTFAKYPSAVIGPEDAIRIPPGSEQSDYEAELAFVIGRRARRVPAADAMRHVLGYMNFNDVSARDFQFADGQWTRGKSCDTFAPMGECVVSADEIADPHQLRIRLRLNGTTMQDSSTSQLIFRIPELIEFLSASATLEPGDVVATGTPPGVGFARKPPVWLGDGDVVEVEIDGLGVLRNPVRRG